MYRESKNNKLKHTLARTIAGKIVKKYKVFTELKKIAPLLKKKKYSLDHIDIKNGRREKKKSQLLKKEIQDFYHANCTIDPTKKHCKKVNGEITPRLYLNHSIIDLYVKFCSMRSPNDKIGLSSFTKYKPKQCVALKITARDTCACLVHENFSLLVKALNARQIIQENTPHKIVRAMTCDKIEVECLGRTCNECKNKEINIDKNVKADSPILFKKWVTKKEKRISAKTGLEINPAVTKTEEYSEPKANIIKIFKNDLSNFIQHEFRIFHQYNQFSQLKQQLKDSEVFITMDFSENYLCKYTTEVQAVHFGASRQQITIHTGYFYHSQLKRGFCTISPSLDHDPSAIITHLKEALKSFSPILDAVTTIHFLSDGPTSQYRNKSLFYLISHDLMNWLPQVQALTYNFSVAGHGKSPCDGVGAVLKRTADDQVKFGRDINNFEMFHSALLQKGLEINISSVSQEEIKKMGDILAKATLKPFVGTMKVQQWTWSRNHARTLYFNSLSCFQCAPGSVCKHFSLGQLSYEETN